MTKQLKHLKVWSNFIKTDEKRTDECDLCDCDWESNKNQSQDTQLQLHVLLRIFYQIWSMKEIVSNFGKYTYWFSFQQLNKTIDTMPKTV